MKIPNGILDRFEKAIIGLEYGAVSLCLEVKQGRQRFIIIREESHIPDKDQSGHDESSPG